MVLHRLSKTGNSRRSNCGHKYVNAAARPPVLEVFHDLFWKRRMGQSGSKNGRKVLGRVETSMLLGEASKSLGLALSPLLFLTRTQESCSAYSPLLNTTKHGFVSDRCLQWGSLQYRFRPCEG